MVDMRDTTHLRATMRPNTRMVWVETPTNPLLKVIDIVAVCEYVKSVDPTIIVVVDNTFMSPYFQVDYLFFIIICFIIFIYLLVLFSIFLKYLFLHPASTVARRHHSVTLNHEIHQRTYGCGDGLCDDE